MQKDLTQDKLDWIFENIKKDDNASGGFTINRTTRNHKLRVNYHYLGEDFRSDCITYVNLT